MRQSPTFSIRSSSWMLASCPAASGCAARLSKKDRIPAGNRQQTLDDTASVSSRVVGKGTTQVDVLGSMWHPSKQREKVMAGNSVLPSSPAYRSATKAAPYSSTAVSAKGAKSKSATACPPRASRRCTASVHAACMAAGRHGKREGGREHTALSAGGEAQMQQHTQLLFSNKNSNMQAQVYGQPETKVPYH